MDAVTGAQRSARISSRSIKCISDTQSIGMCSRRVKTRKQMWIKSVAKSDNTSANEQSEDVALTMKVLVVADIDNTTNVNKVAIISSLPKCHMPAITTTPTNTRQLLRNLLSFTLITMLYLILCLPAPSLIEAAPVTWSNACGYSLNKQHVNKTAPRAKVLCELRGNLTKQIKALRPFMGPKNISEVYSKHPYAFLKVGGRKNLTLSTWHKHLQVYALTVDRLIRNASNYKNFTFHSNKSDNITKTSLQRLKHLNNSLLGILCDIQVVASSLKGRRINTTIDVVAANKRIILSTDNRSPNEGVDPVDIDIVYDKLRKFLLNMRRHIGRIYKCRENKKGRRKTTEASMNRRRLQAKHNHSKKP